MFKSFLILEFPQRYSALCSQFAQKKASAVYANFTLCSNVDAVTKQGVPMAWKYSYLRSSPHSFHINIELCLQLGNGSFSLPTQLSSTKGYLISKAGTR
jgi:hypothetical protein